MCFKICCFVFLSVFSLIGEVVADVSVTSPWIRPAKATQNTALYMKLVCSKGQDRLIKAECEAAEYVELHNNIEENGVMKMRPVQSIGIQEPVDLKPGGLHIMLFNLKKELPVGEKIPVSLIFEKAGKIDLLVEVGPPKLSLKGDTMDCL